MQRGRYRNQFWFFWGKILGNWDGKIWVPLINDFRNATWLSSKLKPSLLSFTQFSCEKNLIWLYYVLFYPHTMSLNKLFAIETLYFWHVNWFYLSGFRFWLSPHILTYIIHLISRDDWAWAVGGWFDAEKNRNGNLGKFSLGICEFEQGIKC